MIYVANNRKYIDKYNSVLKSHNIYVEYYCRKKKNGEWILPKIDLQYIKVID